MNGIYIRQNAIIINVVPVVAWLGCDDELLQPLDTSSANLTWNDGPKRLAVIWSQHFTIHTMCEHDTPIRIHGPIELHRGAIVTIWLDGFVSF